MVEPWSLLLSWTVGVGLGTLFFGGLWWTVRHAVAAQHPALWVFGSIVLRTSVTLTGFYLVAGDQWERLLLCLLGFVVARVAVTRASRPAVQTGESPGLEARHAS